MAKKGTKAYYRQNKERLKRKQREYERKANRSYFFENFVIPFILLRDKHKCIECWSKENLDVHHRKYNPISLNPKDLETLCKKCHRKKHREAGKK